MWEYILENSYLFTKGLRSLRMVKGLISDKILEESPFIDKLLHDLRSKITETTKVNYFIDKATISSLVFCPNTLLIRLLISPDMSMIFRINYFEIFHQ